MIGRFRRGGNGAMNPELGPKERPYSTSRMQENLLLGELTALPQTL